MQAEEGRLEGGMPGNMAGPPLVPSTRKHHFTVAKGLLPVEELHTHSLRVALTALFCRWGDEGPGPPLQPG